MQYLLTEEEYAAINKDRVPRKMAEAYAALLVQWADKVLSRTITHPYQQALVREYVEEHPKPNFEEFAEKWKP